MVFDFNVVLDTFLTIPNSFHLNYSSPYNHLAEHNKHYNRNVPLNGFRFTSQSLGSFNHWLKSEDRNVQHNKKNICAGCAFIGMATIYLCWFHPQN